MKKIFAVIFFIALTLAPAWARNWHISDFHSTVSVNDQGAVVVMERIAVVFDGSYQGIYRTIPVDYPGPNGTNYRLFLKVESVTDGDGNALKYESHRNGAYRKRKIFIPGAEDTQKTVIITYSVPNATRFFDDHDEFYWNVTGNDWPVPIDQATAYVKFPPGASGSLRAQAFTGVYGSHDEEATSEVNGSDVNFATTNPLPMRGGLTVDVYIPKGVLHPPSAITKFVWFIRGDPAAAHSDLGASGDVVHLVHLGTRSRSGVSVAPQYEPPKGFTPAEAGSLVDDAVHPRDITSTIVDLAVRGYLKIQEINEKVLLFSHKDYEFQLLKPMSEWGDLAPHETVMMTDLFQGGESTRLSSLKNRFYTAIPILKQDIMAALRRKGMYIVDPDSAHSYVFVAAVVIAIPFILGQYLGWISLLDAPLVTAVGIAISALIIWLFGRQMTAKTVLGGRTAVQVLGFQEFMNRVDADRLKRMPPDTFEKFLPYAMALGVEHH